MEDFIMDKRMMLLYLTKLNELLLSDGEHLEVWVSGGANMCLLVQSRESTHDIDTFTKQVELLISMSERMSKLFNLPKGWLNPSGTIFVTEQMCNDSTLGFDFTNLKVHFLNWKPMLVLKVVSGRDRKEFHDFDDAVAIIKKYGVDSPQSINEWIDYYMPGWNNPFVMRFATEAWNVANDLLQPSDKF